MTVEEIEEHLKSNPEMWIDFNEPAGCVMLDGCFSLLDLENLLFVARAKLQPRHNGEAS